MSTTPNPSSARRVLTAIDRSGLWVVAIGATLVAGIHLVLMVLAGTQMLGAGPLTVSGLAIENPASPEFTEQLPAVTEAHYDSATVTVEGAPAGARWLLWTGQAASSLTAIGVCAALVWLCVRIGRQRPFGRSITTALNLVAAVIIVGGTLSQVLTGFGQAAAVDFLGPEAAAWPEDTHEGFTALLLTVDFAPIGIGLALSVVAAAFGIGTRMQRDTEGLV